jgi:hypothetical protein
MIAGVENPLSADHVEPHDGRTGPQLLGDVEAALTALEGFALLDRDKTLDVMKLMNAKIAEVRMKLSTGPRYCHCRRTSPPGLPYK